MVDELEAVILGSAQDGGLPHAGCLCANCRAARGDWTLRRLPASLGLRSGDAWAIVDTTRAFEEQLHLLWQRRPSSHDYQQQRYAGPDAIVLTHAHPGHFVGLWQLDRSVLAADQTPVYCPPEMADLLKCERLWGGMERDGFIDITSMTLDDQIGLLPGISLTPVHVPHRSELGVETVALIVEGPSRSLLYLPDIDAWDDWDRSIEDVCRSVDVAILDGCFWAAPPAPGIPHPPIRETMERLGELAAIGEMRIVFAHVNHSNPVFQAESCEAVEVAERGFSIAREGMSFAL